MPSKTADMKKYFAYRWTIFDHKNTNNMKNTHAQNKRKFMRMSQVDWTFWKLNESNQILVDTCVEFFRGGTWVFANSTHQRNTFE